MAASSVHAWGPLLHRDINRAAARAVPDEMAAWRGYADLMANHSSDPDSWKSQDVAEGCRHFIDLELYGDPATVQLPRDLASLPLARDREFLREAGTAPWTILDLHTRLTGLMSRQAWPEAARVAAALGHYVADIHQPLHCTENYDGQLTGNKGIHLRWEDTMPSSHWSSRLIQPEPGTYLAHPWEPVMAWIRDSNARHPDILRADDAARQASREETESAAYYLGLWSGSHVLFIARANAAATDLASLWYSAWVDAGRPPIPPPPKRLSEHSVHRTEPFRQGLPSPLHP